VEELEIDLHRFMNRRMEELYSRTRWEIIASIAAALFFVAVIAWRFGLAQDRLPQLGLALVIAWVLISVYWFRDRIWRRTAPATDAVAATGLEYYRRELEHRRDHLKNIWVWHGPLLLACVILVVVLAGKGLPNSQRLWNLLPFVVLLVIWTGVGFRLRQRQAGELQREIDEIDRLRREPGQ
jgi:hypothetical protein